MRISIFFTLIFSLLGSLWAAVPSYAPPPNPDTGLRQSAVHWCVVAEAVVVEPAQENQLPPVGSVPGSCALPPQNVAWLLSYLVVKRGGMAKPTLSLSPLFFFASR